MAGVVVTVTEPDGERAWAQRAIAALEAEGRRSADTHLISLPIPGLPEQNFYFKDESAHPTGSLKHRLGRSLFLYGICNGKITQGTQLTDASSGSTAVSEAYYARLLGLEFTAVLPRTTSRRKVEAITQQGGRCHMVEDPSTMYAEAARLAAESNGYYLDQFTYAERATDWRGNNNIAESIFRQMESEPHQVPSWIIVGAGTGGTSATIGRYIRYRAHATKLCVPDVEHSAFYDGWSMRDPNARADRPSRIEGIGRPRVELSFMPDVIDMMIKVPDAASLAAMRHLEQATGRRAGGSTGTNLWGAFSLVAEMVAAGRQGSVVTLLCDGGERYAHTYYSDEWLAAEGLDLGPCAATLQGFTATGRWTEPA